MFLGLAIWIVGFANFGCSLLQCPVSQLCSWQARSKQAKHKNLDVEDENDFEDVWGRWWETCLMRSTARARRPSKVIASGVRKPGPPSPGMESWLFLANLTLSHASEIWRHPDFKCTCLKIPATGKLAFVGDFHHPWWHLKQSIQCNCIFHLLLNC